MTLGICDNTVFFKLIVVFNRVPVGSNWSQSRGVLRFERLLNRNFSFPSHILHNYSLLSVPNLPQRPSSPPMHSTVKIKCSDQSISSWERILRYYNLKCSKLIGINDGFSAFFSNGNDADLLFSESTIAEIERAQCTLGYIILLRFFKFWEFQLQTSIFYCTIKF